LGYHAAEEPYSLEEAVYPGIDAPIGARPLSSSASGATVASGGIELLDDPVALELLNSTIPARLAYNWTDGTPRVVSIWFQRTGNDIVMCTFQAAPKLRALQSGDRVALTIDTNEAPNHILSIRGTAEVTTQRGVVEEYARAAERYLGKPEADAYIGSLAADIPMARIAVHPERVVVLDFEARFPSALSQLGLAP
jgi:hypothetical protein